MRILITNDDGIDAPGLKALHELALQLTSSDQIITAAPAFEQSGVGHCISFTKPLSYEKTGDQSYAIVGSPADCVIVGIFEIMDGNKPDLILSGINKGNNAAQNTLYSGTVGATIEASMHGVPSIALSQFYGPALTNTKDMFEAARATGVDVIQKILNANRWDSDAGKLFYNVNFPPFPAKDVKGIKITTQGFRDGSPFSTERRKADLWIKGTPQHQETAVGSDVHANVNGYTSITPCHIDLTHHALISALRAEIE